MSPSKPKEEIPTKADNQNKKYQAPRRYSPYRSSSGGLVGNVGPPGYPGLPESN
jgi:hypothetical protein